MDEKTHRCSMIYKCKHTSCYHYDLHKYEPLYCKAKCSRLNDELTTCVIHEKSEFITKEEFIL